VRLVADLIRGKKVAEARAILRFNLKGSAPAISKLLESAVANAENAVDDPRQRPDADELIIEYIAVNEGRTTRRYASGPRGRAMRTRRRSSQIDITLTSATNKKK